MSLKLYFLRHGQAGTRQDWQGDDSRRPLTGEGKKRMKREAATIVEMDLRIDAIITSPLDRALQTAEIVANAVGPQTSLEEDARLGLGFGPKQLAAIVAKHREAEGLMLVGHEPDFSETIGALTGGGRVNMKKGALACVEVDDGAGLKGTLAWLIPP